MGTRELKFRGLPCVPACWMVVAAMPAIVFGQGGPPTEGLVAYWPFDGNAQAAAGRFHGQENGGVTYVDGGSGRRRTSTG